MIKEYLKLIETATDLPLKLFETDTKENCIVYNFSTITDNTAVAQYKMEIRIITDSMEKSLEEENAIKQKLLTFSCNGDLQLNGGGILRDYETGKVHNILYFSIIRKSEVQL